MEAVRSEIAGRIPPAAIDLEVSVLGAMLTSRETYYDFFYRLSADHFYSPQNRIVFDAIKKVHESNEAPDLVSVEAILTDSGTLPQIGGINTLFDMTNAASFNTEFHIEILHDRMIRRNAILECTEIIKQAYEADAYVVLDRMSAASTGIGSGSVKPASLTPSQIMEREKNAPVAEKLYTGTRKLDEVLYPDCGLVRGEVELTIADSGHGKTQYAMFKAAKLMQRGYKVHWIQLEDYDTSTAEYFARVCGEYRDNVKICHSLRDIEDLKRECRRVKKEFKSDYIVFDYVQNIDANKKERSGNVEYISQQITRLAQDLNVVCHVLSQVTIDYGKRHGWRQEPNYGDVRWSQQLKQDAHIITSVFRPKMVDGLIEGEHVLDWDGRQQPMDSVYVRQCKVRKGKQEIKRLQLIHVDHGLELYTNREVV